MNRDEELNDLKLEKNKDNKKNIWKKIIAKFFTLLIFIFTIIVIFQAYDLGKYLFNLWKNDQNSKLAQEIFNDNLKQIQDILPSSIDSFDAKVLDVPNVGISELKKQFKNNDIFGYVYISDTKISYPIVHTNDNSYYLNHDLYKKGNISGSIFLDSNNNKELTNMNNIIYGHNMKNGSMFHNLRYYHDKDFYDNHRYIIVSLPNKTTVWEIFSAYDTVIDFNYTQSNFSDKLEFEKFISNIKKKSLYSTNVDVVVDDTILTLSTCTNITDDTRFTIHAKQLIPK